MYDESRMFLAANNFNFFSSLFIARYLICERCCHLCTFFFLFRVYSGVVAGATSCEDRSGTNIPPPIIAWPTTTGLPQQQHHTAQQWNPYAGTLDPYV